MITEMNDVQNKEIILLQKTLIVKSFAWNFYRINTIYKDKKNALKI